MFLLVQLVEMVDKYMILSMASDMSVRIWSLTGSFLGILGQKSTWNNEVTTLGFVASKKVQQEIETAGTSIGMKDCGISSFHMSKHEVKPILVRHSAVDLTVKTAKLERKASRSESVSSLDQMCEDIDQSEKSLLGPAYHDNLFNVDTSYGSSNYSSTILSNISTETLEEKIELKSTYAHFLLNLWDKVKTKSKYEIPADLKRVGSFTTLYVLESELSVKNLSKWAKVRHATVWIVNYLQPQNTRLFYRFTLPNADASKVRVLISII